MTVSMDTNGYVVFFPSSGTPFGACSFPGNGGGQLTWTYTPIANATGIVMFCQNFESGGAGGAVVNGTPTYGGTNMVLAGTKTGMPNTQNSMYLWGLGGAAGGGGVPTGAVSVSIPINGGTGNFARVLMISVTGNNTSIGGLFRSGSFASATLSATSGAISTSVTTSPGDMIVDMVSSATTTDVWTALNSQVPWAEATFTSNTITNEGGSTFSVPLGGGTTFTDSWSTSPSDNYTLTSASIQTLTPPATATVDGSGGSSIFRVRRPGWPRYASRRPIAPRPLLVGWRPGLIVPRRPPLLRAASYDEAA